MVTGGLDAKYGNALSGVVNITTKEGGEKFGGGVRFLTDDFGRQDKTFTNYDRFEYGFGGPTPLKGLTYYFAGDLIFTGIPVSDEYRATKRRIGVPMPSGTLQLILRNCHAVESVV